MSRQPFHSTKYGKIRRATTSYFYRRLLVRLLIGTVDVLDGLYDDGEEIGLLDLSDWFVLLKFLQDGACRDRHQKFLLICMYSGLYRLVVRYLIAHS